MTRRRPFRKVIVVSRCGDLRYFLLVRGFVDVYAAETMAEFVRLMEKREDDQVIVIDWLTVPRLAQHIMRYLRAFRRVHVILLTPPQNARTSRLASQIVRDGDNFRPRLLDAMTVALRKCHTIAKVSA